jgi:hypothetical protein
MRIINNCDKAKLLKITQITSVAYVIEEDQSICSRGGAFGQVLLGMER